MTRFRDYLKRPSTRMFLAFAAVYAIAMGVIFWGTWGLDRAPVEPDNPTSYPIDLLARRFAEICGGADCHPLSFTVFLGGPYFWQELQYALAGFLAALGMTFYLRGRGLSRLAAYGAGAAYGLMGYNFTLFSAGHFGWFVWLYYGPFAFGLVDRSVRRGRWHDWALLGAVLAWASFQQPDLWLLFSVMTFFYGVWCLVRERAWSRPRLWMGVALTLVVFAACGATSICRAALDNVASREKQISDSTGSQAEKAEEGRSAADDSKRWDFCTSWSLPPDEAWEFVFGPAKGDSSDPRVNPSAPYRGRIGQRFTVPAGQRMRDPATGKIYAGGDVVYMPYRQHSLYFGLLSCAFALVGVVFGLRWKNRVRGAADVPFWFAMFVLFLFCAFGGFTPFYRIVYKLPVGDLIRCPVKFVHLLEFCAAALAGFGLQSLLDGGARRGWAKGMAVVLGVLALVNVGDLVRTDRRFLAVEDVTFLRAPNAAAEQVVSAGGGMVLVAADQAEGRDVLANSFGLHLAPATTDVAAQDIRFVFATSRGLAAAPAFAERLKSGQLEMLGTYAWARTRGVYAVAADRAGAALFRVKGVPQPPPADPKPIEGRRRVLAYLSDVTSALVLGWCGIVLIRRRRDGRLA